MDTEIEERLDDLESQISELFELVERAEELESRIDDFAERYEVEELESRIDVIETTQNFQSRINSDLEFFLKGIGKIFTNKEFTTYIQEEKEE